MRTNDRVCPPAAEPATLHRDTGCNCPHLRASGGPDSVPALPLERNTGIPCGGKARFLPSPTRTEMTNSGQSSLTCNEFFLHELPTVTVQLDLVPTWIKQMVRSRGRRSLNASLGGHPGCGRCPPVQKTGPWPGRTMLWLALICPSHI